MADRFILTRDPQAGPTDVRYLLPEEFRRKYQQAVDGLYCGIYSIVEPFEDREGHGFIVDGWITYRESTGRE